MPIPFSELFGRLGKLAGSLNKAGDYHGDTVASRAAIIESAYSSNPELLNGFSSAVEAATLSGSKWAFYLSQLAQADIIAVVDADNPQPDKSIYTAAVELIRQMELAGESVAPVDIDFSVTPFTTNNGSATWVFSERYANGKTCVYSHPEDLIATVTSDSQPGGGATIGKEKLTISGEYSIGGRLDPRYPRGSATRLSISAVSPAFDSEGGYGNWLRNSDFNEWELLSSEMSGYIPKYWTIVVGNVGVDVIQDETSGYAGTSCMVFTSDGSTKSRVYQMFNSFFGTPVEIQPLQQFAICARLKSGTDSLLDGTLRIALVDDLNLVTSDQMGKPNSAYYSLSGIGSSWVTAIATFRTPLVLPSTTKLEFWLSTPPASGKKLLVDHVCMTRMVPLYSYGPSVAVFSSNDPLIRGDSWSIRVTTTSSNKSWHRAFDQLVGGASMNLVLPVAGYMQTPTISSSLIDYPPGSSEPGESGGEMLSSGWDDDNLEGTNQFPVDPEA